MLTREGKALWKIDSCTNTFHLVAQVESLADDILFADGKIATKFAMWNFYAI
jgi:hypothetical protein